MNERCKSCGNGFCARCHSECPDCGRDSEHPSNQDPVAEYGLNSPAEDDE